MELIESLRSPQMVDPQTVHQDEFECGRADARLVVESTDHPIANKEAVVAKLNRVFRGAIQLRESIRKLRAHLECEATARRLQVVPWRREFRRFRQRWLGRANHDSVVELVSEARKC